MKISKILENEKIELVGAKPNTAQKAWPDVTYRGNDLFDAYINGQDALESDVRAKDKQECYLGYSPKQDTFTVDSIPGQRTKMVIFTVWNQK